MLRFPALDYVINFNSFHLQYEIPSSSDYLTITRSNKCGCTQIRFNYPGVGFAVMKGYVCISDDLGRNESEQPFTDVCAVGTGPDMWNFFVCTSWLDELRIKKFSVASNHYLISGKEPHFLQSSSPHTINNVEKMGLTRNEISLQIESIDMAM